MKLWLEQRAAELPRKSSLAEAVGYALNQWDGLVRFLDDGRIEIDGYVSFFVCIWPVALFPGVSALTPGSGRRTE